MVTTKTLDVRCMIERGKDGMAYCWMKSGAVTLPVKVEISILEEANVLKDGKFIWKMAKGASIDSSDIIAWYPEAMSPEDEQELQRLIDNYCIE